MKQFSDGLSQDISLALNKALEAPELKKASERFSTTVLGMDNSKTQEEVQFWKRKGTRASEAYFQSWLENKVKFEKVAGGYGIPDNIADQMFIEKHGEQPGLMGSQDIKAQQRSEIKQFGAYMMSYLVNQIIQSAGEYSKANIMTEAQIRQSSGLAFNYNSVMGNYLLQSQTGMQNELQRLEVERMRKGMLGSIGGSAIGLLGGLALAPATGGMSLPIMTMLGGTVGSELGSIMGTEDIAGKMGQHLPIMQYNKLMEEWMGLTGPRIEAYKDYSVADYKTRARLGNIGINGRGLGYDDASLRRMQLGMGSIAGYDSDAFLSQLAFSRAEGLDPGDVFAGNISTRYTGQTFGAQQLARLKNLGGMTGMQTRMPEMISGFNKLSEMFARLDNKSGEQGILQSASLLNTIYGDTEKGRLSGMGLETFAQMQGMFNQAPGSAGDAFMFNALRGLHGGNLREFEILKEQGLTNKDTFGEVLKSIEAYGPEKGYFAFRGLGLTPTMANQLSDKIKTSGGAEGVMREWDEKNKEISKNTEDSKDVLDQILTQGKNSTSFAEKFQADITNSLKAIGSDIANIWATIHNMDIDRQNLLVGSTDLQNSMMNSLTNDLKPVLEEVKKIIDLRNFSQEMQKGITQTEKDFLWDVSQKPGSKEFAKAWEQIQKNPELIHFFAKDEDIERSDDEIIIPYKNGERFMKIKSGFPLNDKEKFIIDPSTNEAETMERTASDIRGKVRGEGQGHSSIDMNIRMTVNFDSVDSAFEEARNETKRQMAVLARSYKRTID